MKSRALPQLRLLLRFTGLFLAWSIIVGLIHYSGRVYLVVHFAKICTLFGAFLGLIAVVVALLFGEVRNPRAFKLTLALCTSAMPACLTVLMMSLAMMMSFAIMSLPPELGISVSDAIRGLALMSISPCVIWFSQIVARYYLREISPRKRKQKPA